MENLIQRWAFLSKSQFGLFFQKSGQFPNFEIGRVGLPPSCIAVSVAEHTLTSVNISNYLWRYLSTMHEGSEYAWSPYMFDRLLNQVFRFYKKPLFWIWHSCICKDYIYKVWNMSDYGSIPFINIWMYFNMP